MVKKQQGQLTVTIKQKDSTEKFIEFTPTMYRVLLVLLVTFLYVLLIKYNMRTYCVHMLLYTFRLASTVSFRVGAVAELLVYVVP